MALDGGAEWMGCFAQNVTLPPSEHVRVLCVWCGMLRIRYIEIACLLHLVM